ncbi:MAG: DNA-binding protein [Aquincola sp.]|nr:DNA-binding protein [Aquincola sp.]MBU18127.1 hypothetical protein [Chloroflexota bacterium]
MKNSPSFEPTAVERVCAAFVERGETVADWARSHGFEPPQVYAVLAGRNKGRYGRGHEIAVALGLKAEHPTPPQLLADAGSGQCQSTSTSSPQSVVGDTAHVGKPGGCTPIHERRRA